MNALEELRHAAKCCGQTNACYNCEHAYPDNTLSDIADHIEAEYMELPKDMNGEVIHIGDRVEHRYGSGETVEVYGVNDHAVYTQIGGHGSDLLKLSKHETIDDVRNEITKDWDYARDLIDRAYECGKRDAE